MTFLDPEVAQSLCGEDHIIKGVSVHVSNAAPKSEMNRQQNYGGGSNGGMGNNGNNGNNGNGQGSYNQNQNQNQKYSKCKINAIKLKEDSSKISLKYILASNYQSSRQDNQQFTGNRGNDRGNNSGSGNGGNYMPMHNNHGGNAWSQNRNNMDMPNLQALGINPQGQNPSNQGQNNMNNPLGE